MKIVNPDSLAATLDAVNEAFFYGRSLSKSEKGRAAKWIASRQGQPGSYRGITFAPTENDFRQGISLFTGERMTSRGGTAHILGEEACRALILLEVSISDVRAALHRATMGVTDILRKTREGYHWREQPGEFCCARCTCAVWRHLAVGGLQDVDHDLWLTAGMKALRAHRDGSGKWRRFPFHYTLLALSEIDHPLVIKEMRYVAPACEQYLKRSSKDDKFAARRRVLAERILDKC